MTWQTVPNTNITGSKIAHHNGKLQLSVIQHKRNNYPHSVPHVTSVFKTTAASEIQRSTPRRRAAVLKLLLFHR